ncbi:hypothetical protein O9929_03025 [Vibrio lentus]|nr:hypothetical protein [Vibrio lentus]
MELINDSEVSSRNFVLCGFTFRNEGQTLPTTRDHQPVSQRGIHGTITLYVESLMLVTDRSTTSKTQITGFLHMKQLSS